MYSSVTPEKRFEVVDTNTLHVACDGGDNPALGHPRIYLDINPDKGRIACPYCSREFVYKPQ